MNTVRAKFVCDGIIENEEYKQKTVTMIPVTSGSEENKTFAKYTPSGGLHLVISDETPAADYFQKGKEYFLDIREAVPAEELPTSPGISTDLDEGPALTHGQKIVGITFNPSGSAQVNKAKQLSADLIDICITTAPEGYIGKKMLDMAIHSILAAQMMAVKLITWKEN